MTIAGIDQSLTGTAITIIEDNIEKFFLLSSKKTKGTKCPSIDYTRRLMEIRNDVKKVLDQYKPSYICMEGMAFGAKGSVIFELGGLSHLLRELYFNEDIRFIIAPPTVIKKYATGKGNADKMMMILEAMKRGANIPFFKKIEKQEMFDDNVCDSYFMASFMKDYLDGKCLEFEDKIEKSWEL